MDLNKVMIIGRLTRDPEIRTTPNGANVASFSVATGFTWIDKNDGQKKEQTEFHNVVAWRKLADIIGQYLKKGSQVYIEGRLTTRSWDGQDGKKNYRTEIVADNMIMLGGKSGATGSAPAPMGSAPTQPQMNPEQPAPKNDIPDIQIDDNDIPF
jgi:single-strand DNA-binding protein